ncbi:TetR/AcrR family transcriptional regulator [Novosphingobium sp. ERN07]|uniref:TetR/AcrR family transcriptional regulator n=1 Tax=Novosphingobium sp. ERN07 TaxID=2726187 RepID=UPI0014578EB8|nr:TetR/AcrR family transcriptional regulator [Novosphingobium sp. ERN07]NLR73407.1 TetR/AcrR family transcriptional regulator [Novosphingobium sp. ERN07]
MKKEATDREARVAALLHAAEGVFMRHGFARTTMGMIGEAACMSRPAVYLLFPGKEEIFSALVIALNRRQLACFAERASAQDGLHARLLSICIGWNESVFDVHALHPEARDMDNLGFAAVRQIYDELAEFLAGYFRRDGGLTDDTADIAGRTLALAARGCRVAAQSREDMMAMICQLVAAMAKGHDQASHSR